MPAVKVRAIVLGFWDNTRRRPGDEFLVPEEFADKASWWQRLDQPAKAKAKRGGEERVTPPGNANAVHVPGSPAATRKVESSAGVAPVSEPPPPATGSGDKKVI